MSWLPLKDTEALKSPGAIQEAGPFSSHNAIEDWLICPWMHLNLSLDQDGGNIRDGNFKCGFMNYKKLVFIKMVEVTFETIICFHEEQKSGLHKNGIEWFLIGIYGCIKDKSKIMIYVMYLYFD